MKGEGDFSSAAAAYAREIRVSQPAVPGDLFYNMGNALALSGDTGGAAALYTAALGVHPGRTDYKENRSLLFQNQNESEQKFSLVRYLVWFPVMLLGRYGLWVLVLFLILISGVFLIRSRFSRQRNGAAHYILYGLLIYGLVILAAWEGINERVQVVAAESAVMRRGDSPLYQSLQSIPRGREVLVLEKRAGWCRVRYLQNGVSGWIPEDSLTDWRELVESYAALY